MGSTMDAWSFIRPNNFSRTQVTSIILAARQACVCSTVYATCSYYSCDSSRDIAIARLNSSHQLDHMTSNFPRMPGHPTRRFVAFIVMGVVNN